MSIPLLLLCLLPSLPLGLAGPAHIPTHHLAVDESYFDRIPSCALGCVIGFAATSFPDCNVQDLDCQCTQRSLSGFTIGEGALRCLVSECVGVTTSVFESVYQICANVPGAQPETHATITASMADPSTFALPNPAAASATSPTTTSHSHWPTRTSTHHTPSHHKTTLSTRTVSSSTSDSTSPSSAPTDTAAPITQSAGATPPTIAPLNRGQIAGIAVSGTMISAIALGLLWCVFGAKRKKERRDSDVSFGNKSGGGSSGSGGLRTPGGTPRAGEGFAIPPRFDPPPTPRRGIPANPKQKRWTLWRLAMARKRQSEVPPVPTLMAEQYGAGRGGGPPTLTHESSPMSVKSYHTTSQLLPDKPSLLQPLGAPSQAIPPLPAGAAMYGAAPPSTIPERKPVRFAPDVGMRIITPTPPGSQGSGSSGQSWQENNTSQAVMQSPLRHQPSDPFIDQTFLNDGRRLSNRDLPKLNTMGNPQLPTANQQLMPSLYPPGPYPPHPGLGSGRRGLANAHVSPQPSPNVGSADPFVARASNNAGPAGSTSYFAGASHAPSASSSEFSKYAPLRYSHSNSQRPLTHYTTGSDTSFEDDENTPPEMGPVHTLSPVAEAPSAIKGQSYLYPRVPGVAPSEKQLRVTPSQERDNPMDRRPLPGSPTRKPPPRSQARPQLAIFQPASQGYNTFRGNGNQPPYNTRGPPPGNSHLYSARGPPRHAGYVNANPYRGPETARTTTVTAAQKKRHSPGSPNFSRPQRPGEYNRGPALRPDEYSPRTAAKFQIESAAGPHGERETWGSPIPAPTARGMDRTDRVQVPPPHRGPWRGREPPIGAQWRQ